jgi:hypothetical protein
MSIYAFKHNELVFVDTPDLKGVGSIKGVAASFPTVGHLYIVEMRKALPRSDYPFSAVCLPEGCLSEADCTCGGGGEPLSYCRLHDENVQ